MMDASDKPGRKKAAGSDLTTVLAGIQRTQEAQGQLLVELAQRLLGETVPAEPAPPATTDTPRRRRRARATGPQVAQTKKARQEPEVQEVAGVPNEPQFKNRIAKIEYQIEKILREQPMNDTDLAKEIGQKVGLVRDILKNIRRRGHQLANIESEDAPCWFWRPGASDETPSEVIYEAAKRLMSNRGMSAQNLYNAIGATTLHEKHRVDGVVIQLRRNEDVVNLGGHPRHWIYFIRRPEHGSLGTSLRLPKKVWTGRKK